MTRLRDLDTFDWCDLEKLATEHGWKLQYRRARCEHGYTREQNCVDCESGYVQDTSTYASLPELGTFNGRPLVAESDDAEDVAFVSAAQTRRIVRKLDRLLPSMPNAEN